MIQHTQKNCPPHRCSQYWLKTDQQRFTFTRLLPLRAISINPGQQCIPSVMSCAMGWRCSLNLNIRSNRPFPRPLILAASKPHWRILWLFYLAVCCRTWSLFEPVLLSNTLTHTHTHTHTSGILALISWAQAHNQKCPVGLFFFFFSFLVHVQRGIGLWSSRMFPPRPSRESRQADAVDLPLRHLVAPTVNLTSRKFYAPACLARTSRMRGGGGVVEAPDVLRNYTRKHRQDSAIQLCKNGTLFFIW